MTGSLIFFKTFTKMKNAQLLFLFVLLQTPLFGQQFPTDFAGNYSGQMIISSTKTDADTVEVNFELREIIPDSCWTYRFTYNSEKYGIIVKDYLLKTKQSGHFQDFILDEQNGILMDMTWLNYCLYGTYEVQENLYVFTLQAFNEDLLSNLFIAPTKTPLTTSTNEGEDRITAHSFKPYMQQSVYLWRSVE